MLTKGTSGRSAVTYAGACARPIEPGFHVADAQDIALAYDGEAWYSASSTGEKTGRVAFHEAVAFRRQRAEDPLLAKPGTAPVFILIRHGSKSIVARAKPQPAISISR